MPKPYQDGRDVEQGLRARLESAEAALREAQAFKDWVHSYLDAHGVPHHPPGTHGAEGCRIGDRLDWLLAHRGRLESVEAALRESLRVLAVEDKGDRYCPVVGCGTPVWGEHVPACPFAALGVACEREKP